MEVKIRRGANINLKGSADKIISDAPAEETYALKPGDFPNVVPKLLVKEGAEVKAGSPLFYDKNNEQIVFTSPVSGEVAEVRRGAKRKILEIIILADKEISFEDFGNEALDKLDRDSVVKKLLTSGVWPFIRQRPFDVIADPSVTPKSIFISGFNSAPLGEDYDFILHRQDAQFQAGLNVLAKLTDGKVHLNINGSIKADDAFLNAKNVQINKFYGPHPAGNVGIQIHHIDPINKGETVWVVNPQDVTIIGKLFSEGKYDVSRSIALCGSMVRTPKYFKTRMGSSVKNLLENLLNDGEKRVISGNVLTGTKIEEGGYLGFYDHEITVIPEGGNDQFMGWLTPGFDKFSLSKTFFSWMMPGKEYELSTNMNGEERAFVVSGEYEKVIPMDIYPVHLIKAILIEDIELMENLGIYEVAPEDFALAEYACTSKINAQEIIREGLDLVKKETT
ncbi:MAG: Na(+)-translocating NADH-quinone reductase subunit A [Vicingaceae bacterium]